MGINDEDEEYEDEFNEEPVRNIIGGKMLSLLSDMSEVPMADSSDRQEDFDRLDRPGMMHQVAALYVQGFTYTQIAKQFGVTPTSVRSVVKRESFKQIVDELGEEVMFACRTFLKRGAVTATGVLLDSMASHDEKVRLSAANSVLDRVGLKHTSGIEIKAQINALSILTDDEIMQEIIKDMQRPTARPSYAEEVENVGYDTRDAVGGDKEESV